MTRIITIRPEPGASMTVEGAQKRGIEVEAHPLSRIDPIAWTGPDPHSVDALLVGSANAIRHGGDELLRYHRKPVFAVGRQTADLARQAGFNVELTGAGGLQELLERIEEKSLRILRLAGERHVGLTLPEGVAVETQILYKAEDLPMSDALAEALTRDPLVMLHSAGAAEHFRAECERLNLALATIRIAALGPRIAQAAGKGWGEVGIAPQPADGALLALVADMCH